MKKNLKSLPLIIYFVLKLFNYLICNSRHARKIIFDKFSKSKEYIFYSDKYNFLLFSKDYMISRSTYIDGPYDYSVLKKAIKLLPKDFIKESLIDVGANIGTVSIPAIKDGIFKNSIVFEPNPKIYNILKINIFLNNLSAKIVSYDFCLSSKNNENVSFKMSDINYGDTRFKKIKYSNSFPKNKVKTLDSFLKLVDPFKTLIKIDVQGFELEVLLGSKHFLRSKPPLILELDPLALSKKSFEKIFDIIKKNYCNFFNLNQDNPLKKDISFLQDIFFNLKKTNKLANILLVK